MPTVSAQAPRGFGNVETWVFDLDNTLYPHHLNLWQQVDERIRAYVSDFLKVSKDEAFRLQKNYYKRYGTTMRGMMTEHGMSPDAYLDFVHRIDHSPLEPNPALGAALEKLPGRKLILTNGTRKHANAVMRSSRSTITLKTCSTSQRQTSTPNRYRRSTSASSRAMASILQRPQCSRIWRATSETPHALRMTTVLVVPEGQREVFREDWELEGRDAPYVDHLTDDLNRFLEEIMRRR